LWVSVRIVCVPVKGCGARRYRHAYRALAAVTSGVPEGESRYLASIPLSQGSVLHDVARPGSVAVPATVPGEDGLLVVCPPRLACDLTLIRRS
jgi:hypothetical protein